MNTLAVIGLGYVGLPLVVEFGKHMRTIGFDIAKHKVEACQRGTDPSRELSDAEVQAGQARRLHRRPGPAGRGRHHHRRRAHAGGRGPHPRLPPADRLVHQRRPPHEEGCHRRLRDRTVYPGATEEVCIPVLERESGLKWKQDFFVGYSPERINPGDKEHTLTKILKIVSRRHARDAGEGGAGLRDDHRARACTAPARIKAAEAAKVIENTQRDLNIALMNELAIIFDKLGIDTSEVLEAAGTKWNFLKFKPGLVGGHCIGVDPYYLTHKADMLGYHPQVILAGRRINDGMGKFIAEQTIKHMIAAGSYDQGCQGQRAGPDLQGKLRRPAQQQGHRHHQGTAELRRRRARHRPAGRPRGSHARVRREARALGRPAARRCHRRGGGAQGVRGAVGRGHSAARWSRAVPSSTSRRRSMRQALTAAGYKLWRL